MMSIFYGIQIRDKDVSIALDAIRFICQPDALRHTHITVRGPYTKRIDTSNFEKAKLGAIRIEGPGNFFIEKQSTIFLTCSVPGLVDIWHKPDYKHVRPHITIYDGKNLTEAKQIFNTITNYKWNIYINPSNIVELEKKKHNTEMLNIIEPEFVRYIMQDVLGSEYFDNDKIRIQRIFSLDDITKIKKISFDNRLLILRRIIEMHLLNRMN